MKTLRIATFVGVPDEELIKGFFDPIMTPEENLELKGCLYAVLEAWKNVRVNEDSGQE